MKILIIEDEVEIARLLATAVEMQGHEAAVAHGGEEGLALLREKRPDAVFLDVAMPEMSGIEMLRRIRAAQSSIPVIVITGYASPAEIEEARRLGVTDIIEKPVVLKSLPQALAGLNFPKA